MNHIPEVAKMLGVEVGEEFAYEVNGRSQDAKLKFTATHLLYIKPQGGWTAEDIILRKLITAEYRIIKLPWKPKKDADFCYVSTNGDAFVLNSRSSGTTKAALILMGNCFRTLDEAEQHKDEIMEKYKGVFKE